MSAISIRASGTAATEALAAALASACRKGDCILLHGELGAGKTTFARGFIRALQLGEEEIVSPTFTLVQTYPTRAGHMIWHFDLYRLKMAAELQEIGLDEALQSGVTLIEWPTLAEALLPDQALTVRIEYGVAEQARQFTLSGADIFWQDRLKTIEVQHDAITAD